MSLGLLILLPRTRDADVRWALVDERGGVRDTGVVGGGDGGDGLPAKARGAGRVVAIAPGADAGLHHVPATKGSASQARTAALFALEDAIAMDLDAVHLALGPKLTDVTRLAVVVAEDTMARWVEQLEALGVVPHVLVPDFLAVPVSAPVSGGAPSGGAAAIVDAGDVVLINCGDAGLTIEPDLVGAIAPSLFADKNWSSIAIASDRAGVLGVDAFGVYGPVDLSPAPDAEAFAAMMFAGAGQPGAVNLLQGAFAPKRDMQLGLGAWRRALVLAGVCGVALLGVGIAETRAFVAAAADARGDAARLVTDTFPDAGRVRDPAGFMRARLSAGNDGGPGQFLTLSALLFEALQANTSVELEGLRFDDRQGTLTASLVFDAYAQLEALRGALEAQGVVVVDRGSRAVGGRQAGDLELGG